MSFIGMGFYGLLRRLGCPIKPAGVLGILFLLSYTVMIGGGVSAMRAFRSVCNAGISDVWNSDRSRFLRQSV